MYVYDELSLLEFFGAEPSISDEFGIDRSYRFNDGTHEVVFGFNEDTSDCSVQLFAIGNAKPLVSVVYLDSPGAKIVTTHIENYLEIGAPNSAPGCTKDWFVPSHGLRLHLKPSVFVGTFYRA